MRSRVRDERGQVLGLLVLILPALLCMGALVIDVGSWYVRDRQTVAQADAAALAGAGALPDLTRARALALEYAAKNPPRECVPVRPPTVTIRSLLATNDAVEVRVQCRASAYLAAVVGIRSVVVGSVAVARHTTPGAAELWK